MKREASLQRFLPVKAKKNFNEIEYDKLYLPGSAPALTYGTPKMHNSPLGIHFLDFVQLLHV